MPKTYFNMIPNILYDVDGSGDKKVVSDIFRRVRTRTEATPQHSLYYEHVITDGDTPEIISYNAYGSTKYHWVVLMMNKITDPYFEFPLSYSDFREFLIKKYGSVARSQGATVNVTEVEPGTTNSNTVYTVAASGTQVSTILFTGDEAFIKVPAAWYSSDISLNGGQSYQAAYGVFQTITKVEPTGSDTARIWTDYNSSINTTAWGTILAGDVTLDTGVHHWEKDVYSAANTTVPIASKLKVDYGQYANIGLLASHKRELSNYDYEDDANESKRTIILLRPDYLKDFVEEFEILMGI